MKKCKYCINFDPSLCGYVAEHGKADENENITEHNFDMEHKCPQFEVNLELFQTI